MRFIRVLTLLWMVVAALEQGYSRDLVLPEGFPSFTIDQNSDPEGGYFFISPQVMTGNKPGCLVIMDNYGIPVFYRKTSHKTYCFQPYPNGYLAYFEGSVLQYVMMDSTYSVTDTMGCKNCDRFDLHEIRILENGHYLLAGKVYRSVDMSALVAGGDTDATIEDYLIQEFDQDDTLVFEWATRDHFAITDVNDKVDLTASVIDPTNFNAIEVESDTSLLLSFAHQDEITKIDRRTGEIIWRLGGKNNDFTFVNSSRSFTRQHDVRRLPNGNITLYDNGTFSDPPYSRGVEYEIDEINMTVTQVWEYDHGKDVFSTHKGNVQRLPGGNTLIGWGGLGEEPAIPAFTEVKPDGTVAIEVSYPENDGSYRVLKFPWRTSLFSTNKDTINFGQWDGYTQSVYILRIKNNSDAALPLTSYHLHTNAFTLEEGLFPMTLAPGEEKSVNILYFPDDIDSSAVNDVLTINSDINSDTLIQRIAVQVHLKGTKYYVATESYFSGHISMYPNPVNDLLTIDSSKPLKGQLCILSLNGSVIFRKDISENHYSIDIKGMEPGTYIVEIFDESSGEYYRKKIVKL